VQWFWFSNESRACSSVMARPFTSGLEGEEGSHHWQERNGGEGEGRGGKLSVKQ